MNYERLVFKSTRHHYEEMRFENDGSATLRSSYDIEPALEYAKRIRDTEDTLKRQTGVEFRHYAVVPRHVLDDAFRQGWFHDEAKWNQWLEHPENKEWKTYRKRLFALS